MKIDYNNEQQTRKIYHKQRKIGNEYARNYIDDFTVCKYVMYRQVIVYVQDRLMFHKLLTNV